MAGVLIVSIVSHAAIFSIIFWILTFVAKFLYSNKYYKTKLNFYECGFKSLSNHHTYYNINFILLLLFLLLYDGEFLIIIPFVLNASIFSLKIYIFFIFFLMWLILTLLLDYIYGALEWQV